MGSFSGIAGALAGLCVWLGATAAVAAEVGAMAQVQRTVYGVPPAGGQAVKREGDAVAFREELETVDRSAALIRFIDDSTLTLGEKSKVLIDEFVFDPGTAEGNALVRISVGTLRYVTGGMPKGKTVIKTPTATLVLRGTDVTVRVRPDGTTDATVNDGIVDGTNDLTNNQTSLVPGQGATFGHDGNSDFSGPQGPSGIGGGDQTGHPEQRRGQAPSGDSGHSDGHSNSNSY